MQQTSLYRVVVTRNSYLSQYMEQVVKKEIPLNYEEERLFRKIWQEIDRALTEGEAFQPKSQPGTSQGPFSPALCEMVSLAVAQGLANVSKLSSEALRQKIIGV